MIDILTSPLSNHLLISGKEYEINTDFRFWIKIWEAFSDSALSPADKVIKIFSNAFISSSLPSDVSEALFAISKFLNPTERENTGESQTVSATPQFSFSYDSGLIYAAFLSQYGIDLISAQMHWWRFLSLFSSLNSCKFTEVMKIRGTSLSSISDPDLKSFIRNMKRFYRLPSENANISDKIDKLF